MPDRIDQQKVICSGGLNSNQNNLDLSQNNPGMATRLVNYEPSLFGGYRRLDGYSAYDADYPVVGAGESEGPVLGLAIFINEQNNTFQIIAARKDSAVDTYSFWRYVPLAGWSKISGGTFAFSGAGKTVTKVRHVQFNFGSGSQIAFVDGVNNAKVYDGTTWYSLSPGNTGGTGSPGGDQLVARPSLVAAFKGHLFLSGDFQFPSAIAHSAPRDALTWTAAAGGGQLDAGYRVVQIKPFRDSLFTFGSNAIQKILANPDLSSSVPFLSDPVTQNVGCIAADSVLEIGGDLMFLAPDGLRPVAGTSRIGDVELETISKNIQGLLVDMTRRFDPDTINGVVLRSKSQVRFFFGDDTEDRISAEGIIGGLTTVQRQIGWEFGALFGIRASCAASEFIGNTEYVLHGDYDGAVYRQEQGSSFGGVDIVSIYSTPYLDFGDTELRKTLHKVNVFVRAEGAFELALSLKYDWGDPDIFLPASYSGAVAGGPIVYGGEGISYGTDGVVYGSSNKPVITYDVQGSGFSTSATFVSVGQTRPHSIQGIVFEHTEDGRR